ncbi:MAG: hypothetical protein ACK5QX_04480, partial [bacterium]
MASRDRRKPSTRQKSMIRILAATDTAVGSARTMLSPNESNGWRSSRVIFAGSRSRSDRPRMSNTNCAR